MHIFSFVCVAKIVSTVYETDNCGAGPLFLLNNKNTLFTVLFFAGNTTVLQKLYIKNPS